MVTVIFPAAGRGKRMGTEKNKVLVNLDGETILVRTLKNFSRISSVNDLIVAVGAAEKDEVSEMLANTPGLKPWQVIIGGAERQYSIANALEFVSPETEIVLVHDAARPLVSSRTIEGVIAAAQTHGAAIAAVREKNTVKRSEGKFVIETIPRDNLWEVQTPQGFRRNLLWDAYAKAAADNFLGTDDASLAERIGASIAIVESDYRNIKLTTPEDLIIAKAFLASLSSPQNSNKP